LKKYPSPLCIFRCHCVYCEPRDSNITFAV